MWDADDKMRFQASKRRGERAGTVWVLNSQQKPEARQLSLGITDGSFSELIAGDVKPGDVVIVSDTASGASRNQQNTNRIPLLQGIGGGGGGRRGGGF
jgi:hypothetical protein